MSDLESMKNFIAAQRQQDSGKFSRNSPTEFNMPEQLSKLPTGGPYNYKPGHDAIVEFIAGEKGLASFKSMPVYKGAETAGISQDSGATTPKSVDESYIEESYSFVKEMVEMYVEQKILGECSPKEMFAAKIILESEDFVENVFEILEQEFLDEFVLDSMINNTTSDVKNDTKFNTVPKASNANTIRQQYLKDTQQAVNQKYDAAKKQAQSKYNQDLAKINEQQKRDMAKNTQTVANTAVQK